MEGLKGQNILVTGGTGFVGSHLVEALVSRGSRVVVLSRSFDPMSYFATQHLERKTILASGDLKDYFRVADTISKYEINYIFHLGAQAIVTTAYDNPRETIETNVMGTANILEAARIYKRVKGIIVASSDKAYGKSSKKYIESDALHGDHPYEASKSSADLIATTYAKTYHLPVVVTRFGNIYGEGDLNFNRIMPGILKALVTGTELSIRSDGTFVRDYVYVKDVILGYLFLVDNIEKAQGQAYNLSSGETLSVLDLIKKVEKVLGKKVKYIIANTQKNEIPYQSLNFEKVMKLGYKPQYSLKGVLLNVFKWYASNL